MVVNRNKKRANQKVLKFNKVHMKAHRRSGLLIAKFALQKLFRYIINYMGATRQNLVSPKSRFLSCSQEKVALFWHDVHAIHSCMNIYSHTKWYVNTYKKATEITVQLLFVVSCEYNHPIHLFIFYHIPSFIVD